MSSFVTLTTSNGQTLKIEGEAQTIASIVAALNYTQPEDSPAPVVADPVKEKAVKYIDFFTSELDKHLTGAKLFVGEMERIRNRDNNYIPLGRIYRELVNRKQAGWAKRRQLLKTASAIWRYTFKPNSDRAKLKYNILASTECQDCGEFATAMVQRMKQEKLWV